MVGNKAAVGRLELKVAAAVVLASIFDVRSGVSADQPAASAQARVPPPSASTAFGEVVLKAIAQGTAYYPLGGGFVLASRLEFGGLYGASASDIAPSQRFYSGGGGSVRGYGYQELGPKDPSNNPIGGASQTEFSLEGRYRFGNYGVGLPGRWAGL